MSKRQTQSVLPSTRKKFRASPEQPPAVGSEMEESPNNAHNGSSAQNENQSLITLLKLFLETQNQQHTAPVFNSNPASCGHHCHCQMLANHCPNQVPNQTSDHFNNESSLNSLLATLLRNQIQPTPVCQSIHSPTHFKQPFVPTCQVQSNCCQHQSKASTSKATANKEEHEEPSTRSLLTTLLKNQAKMNAQMEKVIQTQELIMKKLELIPTISPSPIPNNLTFKKIDTVEECLEFEENLESPEFVQNMIKHFEFVCGKNSDLQGDNVAYAFVDQLFTRRLFTLVSWTGLSRGTESKESFHKFERIFQFFYDLVTRVDADYTITSLKDFFQKIISNSRRRFEHKRRRISRVRPKPNNLEKRKRGALANKESNYVLRNSNVDEEQKVISDEITDNDDDFKDNLSFYSNECNTDEVATIQNLNFIKAEEEEE